MRVHKGSNWTTFHAVGATGEITLMARRVFHPVRGEEAQLDITLVKRTITGGRNSKYTYKGSVEMSPAEVKEFVTVLMGRFVEAQPPRDTNGLNTVVNQYQPVEYAGKLSPREKALVKVAFLDGHDYARSLTDGANTPKAR